MRARDALERQPAGPPTAEGASTGRPPAITVSAPVDVLDADDPARHWTVVAAWRANRPSVRVAAVSVALVAALSATWSAVPIAAAAAVAALVPAAMVDVVDRRLPDRLVAGAAAVFVTVAIGSTAIGSVPWRAAIIGVLALAGPLLVLHLVTPAAMGFGDVKAAIVLGAGIGLADPSLALVALTAASFGAAVWGLARRQRSIPFGPPLVVAGAVTLAIAPLASEVAS